MNRELRIEHVLCEQNGSLPAGGVVFSVAGNRAGNLWVGTSAGLFYEDDGTWRPVLRGFPLRQAPVIAVSHRTVLAAGTDAVVVRSADHGKTWQRCLLPPQVTAVTSLVMSPSFSQDGVTIAGTDMQGILRSVDGGRSWKYANFGLRNFQVNAIAAAPYWQRKEPVFAALEQGIYYSPNGGRAWQSAGLPGEIVLCITVSPDFWRDGLVAAGGADGSIYISRNQGRDWLASKPDGENQDPINSLHFLPGGELVAGSGSGKIFRSIDNGFSWDLIAIFSDAVLTLAEFGGTVLAGVGATGLFRSSDLGKTWQQDERLCARRVHVLAYKGEQHLAVGGVSEGIWLSQDEGKTWEEARSPEGERISALSLAWEGGNLLAACIKSVTRLAPQQATYDDAMGGIEVLSLASCKSGIWAGGADGSLWHKPSHEAGWQQAHSPCRGAVISIYCSDEAGQSSSILVVCRAEEDRRLEFWQSDDQGSHWHLMRVETTTSSSVRCAYLDDRWYIVLGSSLLFFGLEGWQRVRISDDDAPVLALLGLPGKGLVAATADRLLFSSDTINWTKLPCEMAMDGIVDLNLTRMADHQAEMTGLTSNGRFFRLVITVS